MNGRVTWLDAEGSRHSVNTHNQVEHTTLCKSLRRKGRTILKATPVSKVR